VHWQHSSISAHARCQAINPLRFLCTNRPVAWSKPWVLARLLRIISSHQHEHPACSQVPCPDPAQHRSAPPTPTTHLQCQAQSSPPHHHHHPDDWGMRCLRSKAGRPPRPSPPHGKCPGLPPPHPPHGQVQACRPGPAAWCCSQTRSRHRPRSHHRQPLLIPGRRCSG
jgi:hypothetical protein